MAFVLPKCWADDERMNVLFQPFKDRSLNPHSWDCKMQFWTDLITCFCSSESSRTQITLSELNTVFFRKGKSPSCLLQVLEYMTNNGKTLLTNQQFQDLLVRMKSQQSWIGWAYNVLVRSSVSWTTSLISRQFGTKPINLKAQLIIFSNVTTQACQLLESIQKLAQHSFDCLHALNALRKLNVKTSICKENDFDLLIKYLEATGSLMIFESDNQVWVKCSLTGKKVEPVSETEKGILKLTQTKVTMESRISSLQSNIEAQHLETKQHLLAGNRIKALRSLKKKKSLEKMLSGQVKQLSVLEEVLDRIYAASTDQLVCDAYRHATSVLKAMNSQLSVAQVENVLDDLTETLSTSHDIGALLSDSIAGEVDQSELEDELAELLKEDIPVRQAIADRSGTVHRQELTSLAQNQSIDDLLLSLDTLKVGEFPDKPSEPLTRVCSSNNEAVKI